MIGMRGRWVYVKHFSEALGILNLNAFMKGAAFWVGIKYCSIKSPYNSGATRSQCTLYSDIVSSSVNRA